MSISELNADERLALVALLKLVVLADRRVSEEETDEIQEVVETLGGDPYQKALDTVENRFTDEKKLKEFLSTITNQDARDEIYGLILVAASNEALQGEEPELLGWLAKAWNIQISFNEKDLGE